MSLHVPTGETAEKHTSAYVTATARHRRTFQQHGALGITPTHPRSLDTPITLSMAPYVTPLGGVKRKLLRDPELMRMVLVCPRHVMYPHFMNCVSLHGIPEGSPTHVNLTLACSSI